MAWSLGLPLSGFSNVTWAALLGAAAVSQIIGHTSYNWALKWFSAHMVAISLLGEPVLATLMAWGLLDEKPALIHLIGGGLILSGIYLAASQERKSAENHS
jgi:drug/metabolite transporter (DMT)-like permease